MSYHRLAYTIGLILTITFLGAAFYLQFAKNMQPCTLCDLQRYSLILLALIFLIALLHQPKKLGGLLYGLLIIVVSFAGAYYAGKQIYLQHIAETNPRVPLSCAVHFGSIKFQQGLPDCDKNSGQILGLSLAAWAFLGFIFTTALGFITLFQPSPKDH